MSDSTQNDASTEPRLSTRILVVEDEERDRELFLDALEEEGYDPTPASNLAEAHARLVEEGEGFHLVLLDLILGDQPGEDLFDAIHAYAPDAAVVIVSGHRDEQVIMRCLKKGASDFLAKPFRLDDMYAVIKRALRRQDNAHVRSEDLEADHPTTGWVELTAPSDFEFLTRMQRFSQILFSSQLPRDVAEDMRMIMEEMGRNAIEWGNRFDKGKLFNISYCFFHDRVVLKFEDEGEGFDPKMLPDPSNDPGTHLDNREKEGKRPGGFGVFLVQNIMDEVVYSERGNVVIMTKYLNKDKS